MSGLWLYFNWQQPDLFRNRYKMYAKGALHLQKKTKSFISVMYAAAEGTNRDVQIALL